MELRHIFTQNNIVLCFFLNCLFTYFSAGLLFYRSLNEKISLRKCFLLLAFGISISALYAWVFKYSCQLAQVISFAGSTAVFSMSLKGNRNKTTAVGFMSNGFAHFLRFLSAITVACVFGAFGVGVYNIYMALTANALTLLQAELIARLKRLRNGVQFFHKTDNLGIGIFLSGIIFILTSIDLRRVIVSDTTLLVLLAGITVSGIGMFVWVKLAITRYYKSKLRDRDATLNLRELENRSEELDRLNRTNELLSVVVHRDNHLFLSLKSAADNARSKEELADEIRTLVRERSELIKSEIQEAALMPETGDRMIDNTLHALALSAASKGIRLSANVTAPVTEIIGDSLSLTALQTLISDHVKDAVIAVGSRDDKQGNILLNLARDGRVYTLTVLDNGAPFELHVFDKLGRERVTTHSDSGGSGIGFMQTFSTLRACGCSVVITEFESGLPFTKSVGFRFDGKGKFVIKSPRAEQIKNALTREDVLVINE